MTMPDGFGGCAICGFASHSTADHEGRLRSQDQVAQLATICERIAGDITQDGGFQVKWDTRAEWAAWFAKQLADHGVRVVDAANSTQPGHFCSCGAYVRAGEVCKSDDSLHDVVDAAWLAGNNDALDFAARALEKVLAGERGTWQHAALNSALQKAAAQLDGAETRAFDLAEFNALLKELVALREYKDAQDRANHAAGGREPCANHQSIPKECKYCFSCDRLEFDGRDWSPSELGGNRESGGLR